MSLARQNYSEEAEAAVNAQITMELTASYTYLSMASWCNRDTVALPGLSSFFHRQSREEHQHALTLIDYQAKRGGRTAFPGIPSVKNNGEWKSAMACLEASLQLEQDVNAALLKLHAVAEKNGDPQLEDFVEQHYLEEQVQSIKEIADMVTQCKRVGGDALGLYLFDNEVGKRQQ
jgi:ferritin heavy chain